ncbi:DUF5683 domain-containing protein [Rubrivirga sp.]|uniref:DUF5683 domain-containing protein n=1 Tax=Rubrivirga sp. TaxID=1885344 RepID=UPI003C767DD4
MAFVLEVAVVWLAVGVALSATVLAQPATPPGDLLRAMDGAFARADYDVAEARAREAIARYDELSPDQLVDAHSTLGILLHTRNAPVEARAQFEAALALDPSLVLDPVFVSPRTRAFFDTVRETIEVEPDAAAPEIRYLVLEDRRPDAALRSLALPGWGQFYKQDRGRGLLFAGAAAVTAGGLIVSAIQYSDARSAYRNACYDDSMPPPGLDECTEVDFGEIEGELYDRTNGWKRARDAFAIGAAAVWTAAVLDALVTGAPAAPNQIAIEPASQGAGLALRARF